MRRLLLVCLLLASLVAALHPRWHELEGYTFEQYVKDFRRPYKSGTAEYRKRKAIFNSKIRDIRRHNADSTQTWKRGVNMFIDMSAAEWKRFNALKRTTDEHPPQKVVGAPNSGMQLPFEVDYRQRTSPRVLTAVKHQGSCGSCWAHSAVESLESYFALLTGRLPVLSTQQITSCTPTTDGCEGGFASAGWSYIQSTYHGETEEWVYPYTDFLYDSKIGDPAKSPCKNVTLMYPNTEPYTWFAELTRVGVNGYHRVKSNSARDTMHILATTGPLSIDVAAGNWQDYEAGVFQNSNRTGISNEWAVDHAVQMVGYGYDKVLGRKYWIVRNSWSTLWGEGGYIRLDRPDEEPCNSDPQLFQNTVCGTSGCLMNPTYPLVKELPPTPF